MIRLVTMLCFAAPPVDTDERLARLGRVWSWVKVHHPAFATGEESPDDWLLALLPHVERASDEATADDAMRAAIAELGPLVPCDCQVPPDRVQMADLDWVNGLDEGLRDALLAVRAARPPAEARTHVGRGTPMGVPDFRQEKAWPGPLDAPQRLLSLYRLWGAVEWYSPYRNRLDRPWHDVLAEFVPRALQADTEEQWNRTLAAFSWHIHDSHSHLRGDDTVGLPPEGECTLPVRVRFVEGRVIVVASSVPELAIGDELLAVDGRDVVDLVAEMAPYYGASNEPTQRRDIAKSLGLGACGPAAVRTQTADVEVERGLVYPAPHPPDGMHRVGADAAYVRLDDDVRQQRRALKARRGVIIDARAYPTDFTVFSVGGRLVSEPTPFATFTHVDPAHPGFQLDKEPEVLQPKGRGYEGHVVVLVDENTQSSAEYHAMAFSMAARSTIVGSTTAGADGNVTFLPLPGGRRMSLTGLGVYWPDGRPTQRVGIVPDRFVTPTVAGVRAGSDEVLEAGLLVLFPEAAAAELAAMSRAIRPR